MQSYFATFRPVWAALIALAVLVGCESKSGAAQGAAGAGGPVAVTVVTLKEQTVQLTNTLPGRTSAYRRAQVRPQVSGIIQKRLFTEGARVEAGQPLYQIDPARYEAAVANAEASLARARANLNTARARKERYQNLLADKAVSQQAYDDAFLAFEQARADVAVSEAALQTARIDLRYTQVKAPISGHIGKSTVTEGALVSANQAQVLTTINQLDPIYVDVSQPANRLLAMRREAQNGSLAQAAAPSVKLHLEDGSVYKHQGKLQFAEMDVDPNTGTVVVRALFDNPDNILLPGMFVRAEIEEGIRENAVLVPQRGVTHNRQGEATARVVNGDGKVAVRKITTSRSIYGHWLVESGLAAGDRVIVEGLQKIQPGVPVKAVELGAAQGE